MALSLANQGAEIITYPSAFTFTTGAAHWEVRKFSLNLILRRQQSGFRMTLKNYGQGTERNLAC